MTQLSHSWRHVHTRCRDSGQLSLEFDDLAIRDRDAYPLRAASNGAFASEFFSEAKMWIVGGGWFGVSHGYLEHFCRQTFCYVERALEHQLTLLKENPQHITGGCLLAVAATLSAHPHSGAALSPLLRSHRQTRARLSVLSALAPYSRA